MTMSNGLSTLIIGTVAAVGTIVVLYVLAKAKW